MGATDDEPRENAPTAPAGGGAGPADAPGAAQPSEEEMRARLEEEVRKLRVEEVVLQSAASIVNLTARRIAKEDERDLEQARVGIDAVRALLPMIPAEAQAQLRNAVSELQVLYAREAGGDGEKDSGGGGEQGQGPGAPPPQAPPRGPGRPPPKLWTPPGA